MLDVQPISHALEDEGALARIQRFRAAAAAPATAVAGAAARATPCAAACTAAAAAAAARRASALFRDLHHALRSRRCAGAPRSIVGFGAQKKARGRGVFCAFLGNQRASGGAPARAREGKQYRAQSREALTNRLARCEQLLLGACVVGGTKAAYVPTVEIRLVHPLRPEISIWTENFANSCPEASSLQVRLRVRRFGAPGASVRRGSERSSDPTEQPDAHKPDAQQRARLGVRGLRFRRLRLQRGVRLRPRGSVVGRRARAPQLSGPVQPRLWRGRCGAGQRR